MDKIKKTFLYTLVTMLVFTLGAVPFLSVFAQESFDNETYWIAYKEASPTEKN